MPATIRWARQLSSRRKSLQSLQVVTRSCWLPVLMATGARAMASLVVPPTAQQAVAYEPPVWARASFSNPPVHGRLKLGNFPTPLYRLSFPPDPANAGNADAPPLAFLKTITGEHGIHFYIKRDDSTGGLELGGNKVRKLEFLLADALAQKSSSVVTIGGEQSNHCRATAAAARMVGLQPHLILRSRKADGESNHSSNHDKNNAPGGDLGLVGNLLVNRLLGAQLYTCTPGEYGRFGSTALVERLARCLEKQQGKKPYCIPVGGSNAIGTWGYVEAVQELAAQWPPDGSSLDHVVMACGSGGTTAGIAVGMALAFANRQPNHLPMVHAIGVCDTPDYFYNHVSGILDGMGFRLPHDYSSTEDFVRANLVVHQGKGLGYAVSTAEELEFIQSFAEATGIVLDPVYSGKALYKFLEYMRGEVESSSSSMFPNGSNVLFWHTGGGLGLYDKVPAMQESVQRNAPCQRLDLYGNKIGGIDISEES